MTPASTPASTAAGIADATAADLLEDTSVSRADAGAEGVARYRCNLSDRWNASSFPFGGVASAIALRAMREELASPEHTPRSVTTVFSSAVRHGELEIDVRALRRGRGMSQLEATLRNAGTAEAGHTTLAVFGAVRDGFRFDELTPPEVPAPEACRVPPEPPPTSAMFRASFFDQMEVRSHQMKAPWETDWEPGGPARALRWIRYRKPPRRSDGVLDPIAYLPVCDTMPPSMGQRLGPGQAPFLAPSCDLTVHLLAETEQEWWLSDARTHHASDGYATGTLDLWDIDGRLLARATQLMYIRRELPELESGPDAGA